MDMSRKPPDRRVSSLFRQAFAGLWVSLVVVQVGALRAQPPGTFPPSDLVRPPSESAESDQLPIQGFYFLDVSKNHVFATGMTWERYNELVSESNRQTKRYIFDRVKITGRVEGNRAEMLVEVELELESTGGETLAIPLRLDNFHRISPPEFLVGSDDDTTLAITIDDSTGGYLLLASSQSDKKITFRMQMSARVDSDSLQFSLPNAPVFVELTSDSRDARGEIINRNDEVLLTRKDKSGRSQFVVESGGGRFTLRWGAIEQTESVPLLEASTKMTMRWNSPQDQPIQVVQMVVRDLRESIERFRLRLPEDAVLLDAPVLANSGQALDSIKPDETNDPQLYEIVIPKEEQRQRIDLNLELHIPLEEPATTQGLVVQVPEVVGALRHQGTLEIQTGNDYRLRWRDRPYVQMTTRGERAEGSSETREYLFRFSRGSFALPIWMGAAKRQLRISSRSDLEVSDAYVSLTMEIDPIGSERGSQVIAVDLADWESFQVTSALTGTPLTWHEADDLIEIEAVSGGMDEFSPIMIRARRSIERESQSSDPRVRLAIPRVVTSKDDINPVVVQESSVQLVGKGRSTMVVDLNRSLNLERSGALSTIANERVRRFQVMPPDAAAVLSGVVVEEPPRLVLDAAARVSLGEAGIESVVDWSLESQVDLGGRLRVLISEASGDTEKTAWSATVNGNPAVLVAADAEELDDVLTDDLDSTEVGLERQQRVYDLVSDDLASGTMRIRFESSLPLEDDRPSGEIERAVAIPRPAAEDVSLKSDAKVELIGDADWSLSATDLDASEELLFAEIPAIVPLRLAARAEAEGELVVDRVLIRTAVSEASQHDQVLVVTEGAGVFRLRLRETETTEIRVDVNEDRAAFELQGETLSIVISDPDKSVIDIRLWSGLSSGRHFADVSPLVSPSREINRLYWDVTVPSDRHLIWASPSASRSMQWVFDSWRMVRKPLFSSTEMVSRVATVEATPMPPGNRYQFTAMDGRSLRLKTGSMTAMWMMVASTVLVAGTLLAYIPTLRRPFSLLALLVCFAGIVCVAPDAAIIVGQVAMGGAILIGIMLALKTLVRPLPSRVLESTYESEQDPSTRVLGTRTEESSQEPPPTGDQLLAHASSEATR
ncbi:MAG: hypothetical protein AAFU85_01910 [Planctomycetota bacterium]